MESRLPRRFVRRWASQFVRDTSGQATTEYVLILAVIVTIALLVIRDLVQPLLARFTESISKTIEEKMFKPGSMHKSPFRP
jgi:Flp pilus assembly pilin Flp